MAHSEVVTKWTNAPSRLASQLFPLSQILLQKPDLYLIKLSFSVGSSCVAEPVHIESSCQTAAKRDSYHQHCSRECRPLPIAFLLMS